MSVTILQYENRVLDCTEKLMSRNQLYCERHGYRYVRPTGTYSMSPYWIKVALVKQWMDSGTDYLAWFDSDAVVHQQSTRIEDLFDKHDMLISYDYGDLRNLGRYVANTGVFLFRVNANTRRLVQEWWNGYKPERWYQVQGTWKTEGKWAGPDYEQGYFNTTIVPKFHDSIQILDPERLDDQSLFPSAETFSCHFCYPSKKESAIPLYLIATRKYELLMWVAILGWLVASYKK